MRKLFLIIRREYLVRVRTRTFVVLTVLMPLLLGGMMILPSKMAMQSSGTKHIFIVAADSDLANAIKDDLSHDPAVELRDQKSNKPSFDVSIETKPTEALRNQLSMQVRDGNLDAFVWIDNDAATTRKAIYYSHNGSDFITASQVSRSLRLALSERQLTMHGFTPAQAKLLMGPVDVDTVRVDKDGAKKSNGIGAVLLPFFLLMAIYVTVLIYGLSVMRSVVEEKASRIVEVLLGSVTPLQLMAGKIIGVGAVGFTQVGIWASAAAILGSGSLAIARGVMGDSMKDAHFSTATLVMFPVFFILGYATYASLYAAIGAMVNSDEEAQQLQIPITLPLVLCTIFSMSIIHDPNTPMAFWLSMFPLTSPIIMFLRVSVSMPPIWQIACSILISIGSLYGLVWLTSRIYRVGILMYGKRPTLPEILRWVRYS